jgi:hypothetical protein
MTIEQRISALTQLGKRLHSMNEDELLTLIQNAQSENAWFTPQTIKMAMAGIINFLDEESLFEWIRSYSFPVLKSKTVAIVMAGNIPLVGFHDLLSVLVSGHNALIKVSSKDSVLIRYLYRLIVEIEPGFNTKISFADRLSNFDAVIATGSDNSARYFEYYFEKYPHIIRKNRTSCAILTGDETEINFHDLGVDIFSYFGLGCRNVAKLFVPVQYNFSPLLNTLESYQPIIHHHKYCNNYDYQKSIMLVNCVPFLDNGFLMLTENEKTVSPISVVYYETYKDVKNLNEKLSAIENKLQCIVGNTQPATVPFGQAQYPKLRDYADQIDTLKFLCDLR